MMVRSSAYPFTLWGLLCVAGVTAREGGLQERGKNHFPLPFAGTHWISGRPTVSVSPTIHATRNRDATKSVQLFQVTKFDDLVWNVSSASREGVIYSVCQVAQHCDCKLRCGFCAGSVRLASTCTIAHVWILQSTALYASIFILCKCMSQVTPPA